jgi:hypothetical protein
VQSQGIHQDENDTPDMLSQVAEYEVEVDCSIVGISQRHGWWDIQNRIAIII